VPKRSKTSTRGGRSAVSTKPRSPRRIDFSDIPEASDQQLHAMRGVSQPQLAKALLGYWKISSMEVWGRDYIDLVVPGHITFEAEESHLMGQFQFGTVTGWMDCRLSTTSDDLPLVEWSWEGRNDTDPGCGRGWGRIDDGKLVGRLFIHAGDDSAFEAVRQPAPKRATERTVKSSSRLRH